MTSLLKGFVAGAVGTLIAAMLLTRRRRRQFDGDWSDEQIESLYVAEPRRLVRPARSGR